MCYLFDCLYIDIKLYIIPFEEYVSLLNSVYPEAHHHLNDEP